MNRLEILESLLPPMNGGSFKELKRVYKLNTYKNEVDIWAKNVLPQYIPLAAALEYATLEEACEAIGNLTAYNTSDAIDILIERYSEKSKAEKEKAFKETILEYKRQDDEKKVKESKLDESMLFTEKKAYKKEVVFEPEVKPLTGFKKFLRLFRFR